MSNRSVPGGSGLSAAKTLSTTLEKALIGSGKLINTHNRQSPPRAASDWQRSPHRDRSPVTPRLNSPDSTERDPFAALASSYAVEAGNASAQLLEMVDPLSILLRSWLKCCEDAAHVNHFIALLKRYAGCSEDEAVQIVLRVDAMVIGFQRGAFVWNLLDGVGPTEEDAIVASIRDTLGERGVWADKVEAVWRGALVHVDK